MVTGFVVRGVFIIPDQDQGIDDRDKDSGEKGRALNHSRKSEVAGTQATGRPDRSHNPESHAQSPGTHHDGGFVEEMGTAAEFFLKALFKGKGGVRHGW